MTTFLNTDTFGIILSYLNFTDLLSLRAVSKKKSCELSQMASHDLYISQFVMQKFNNIISSNRYGRITSFSHVTCNYLSELIKISYECVELARKHHVELKKEIKRNKLKNCVYKFEDLNEIGNLIKVDDYSQLKTKEVKVIFNGHPIVGKR